MFCVRTVEGPQRNPTGNSALAAGGGGGAHSEGSRRVSRRSCLTLLAIVALYIVCNIPRHALNMLDHLFHTLQTVDLCTCVPR